MSADGVVTIELSDAERDFMFRNLGEWDGPARGTALLLSMFGLSTTNALRDMARRLGKAIRGGIALTNLDWARALVLTEIAWGSDLLGAGLDANTRSFDVEAVGLLRSIQYKISSGERLLALMQHVGLTGAE
jgi:hypothetical protein